MKFSEELNNLFNTVDLYEIFHIDRYADDETIKRSYKKLSLIYHPDKCKGEENLAKNTQIFQALSKSHKILTNPKHRKYFDDTGEIDDIACESMFSQSLDSIEEWQEYWRALFPKITLDAIIHFENEYKNSSEEKKDLVDSYLKYRGNMDLIMDTIMCATIVDEDRFRDILLDEIQLGNVRKFNRFINEPTVRKDQRRRKFLKEEKEAKKFIKNKRDSDLLSTMIHTNQEKRENAFHSFLDNLMVKYGVDDVQNSDEEILNSSSSTHGTSLTNMGVVGKRGGMGKRTKKRSTKH